MTLGGLVIVHNAIEHDYCVRESIQSLLPICDKVLVVECESTDGTQKLLSDMAEKESKIRIIHRPWNPSLNMQWMRDLTADTKGEIGTDWYIAMDADEIIDPRGYCWVQEHVAKFSKTKVCASMYRLTFWKDHKHVIPEGIICNHICPRVGPVSESLCGDLIYPKECKQIDARIYHYGHIRKRDAWVKKSVKCHQWALGSVPDHWKKAEAGDMSAVDNCVPDSTLVPFTGSHPILMYEWLKERGFES
jgi:hypothetical protein